MLRAESFFDSDQAIVGLMAKHLSEGRAFPLHYYGQHYLLGVEAWLAAPLFAILGPSVAALRAPVLIINVSIGCLLVWVLYRDAELGPVAALTASLFVVLAPPELATHLLVASDINPQPFLYVLLLWVIRRRPFWFGAVLGAGFLHREFAAYGGAAICVMGMLDRPKPAGSQLRAVGLAAVGFLGVWQVVQILYLYSTPTGPGSAVPGEAVRYSNVDEMLSRFNWDPGGVCWGLIEMFRTLLGILFGAVRRPLQVGGGGGVAWEGLEGLWPLLGGTLVLAFVRVVWLSIHQRTPPWRHQSAVGFYLFLVGLQSALVYVLAQGGQVAAHSLRYCLLSVLIGVGVATMFFVIERRRAFRWSFGGVMLLWAGVSASAHVGLLRVSMNYDQPTAFRQVADYLVAHRISFARSDYWTAYHVTFLSGERVHVATSEHPRISQYQAEEESHRKELVLIQKVPCVASAGHEVVAGVFWVCEP